MVAKSKIKDEERDVIRVQMSISRHTSPEIFNELLPLETGQRPERIRALMTLGWNEINKHKYFAVLNSGYAQQAVATIATEMSNSEPNVMKDVSGDPEDVSVSGSGINDGWDDVVSETVVKSEAIQNPISTQLPTSSQAVSRFLKNAGK